MWLYIIHKLFYLTLWPRFEPIWPIVNLDQDVINDKCHDQVSWRYGQYINRKNVLTNMHKDWAINVVIYSVYNISIYFYTYFLLFVTMFKLGWFIIAMHLLFLTTVTNFAEMLLGLTFWHSFMTLLLEMYFLDCSLVFEFTKWPWFQQHVTQFRTRATYY